jgi:hypothetical protein
MSALTRPERSYYRFYCLDGAGAIMSADDSHCETDADALKHAASMLKPKSRCMAIEVWNLTRLVGRVGRD